MFEFFRNIWKTVAGAVANVMRKAGETIIDISKDIASSGIDITDKDIISTISESVNEVDKYGIFDNYGKNQLVLISDMIESSDSMQKTYRTLFEVTFLNPFTKEATKELVSLYHDYNIGEKNIIKELKPKLLNKEQYSERTSIVITDIRRVLVYHKKGSSY